MKKWLLLVFSIIIIFSCTGCGNNSDTSNPQNITDKANSTETTAEDTNSDEFASTGYTSVDVLYDLQTYKCNLRDGEEYYIEYDIPLEELLRATCKKIEYQEICHADRAKAWGTEVSPEMYHKYDVMINAYIEPTLWCDTYLERDNLTGLSLIYIVDCGDNPSVEFNSYSEIKGLDMTFASYSDWDLISVFSTAYSNYIDAGGENRGTLAENPETIIYETVETSDADNPTISKNQIAALINTAIPEWMAEFNTDSDYNTIIDQFGNISITRCGLQSILSGLDLSDVTIDMNDVTYSAFREQWSCDDVAFYGSAYYEYGGEYELTDTVSVYVEPNSIHITNHGTIVFAATIIDTLVMSDGYSTEPDMIDIEMRLKTCDESDEYPYMLEATDGCLILYLDDTLMPVTFQF